EFVSLPLDRFGKRLALFDIALDDVNNKREAECRGKIMENPEPWVQIPRRVIVVEQDANRDEAVTNFLAQENRSDGKREKVEVDERNRDNEMVCVRDRAKRAQDKNERQPRRSIRGHVLPQDGRQCNRFTLISQLSGERLLYRETHSNRTFAIIPLSS